MILLSYDGSADAQAAIDHGAQSFFLGVPHGVLQHAARPVVVVPSARVAAERRSWLAPAPAAAAGPRSA